MCILLRQKELYTILSQLAELRYFPQPVDISSNKSFFLKNKNKITLSVSVFSFAVLIDDTK